MTSNPAVSTATRIRQLAEALSTGLFERNELMRLCLLTAIAGESVFLLGPPGVGKSLVARRLKHAFRDAQSFEYLMTRFSTPDEVFGPVSIKKLKDEDRYERLTDNYLPAASVVFLDEIWKAGSAIQNALLTVMNERVFRNGDQEVPIALRALITASNELPPSGESHEPLWDRLLVRYVVEGIQNRSHFTEMITSNDDVYADTVPEPLKISADELRNWDALIAQVTIDNEVIAALNLIRERIERRNSKHPERPLHIYDRRWKKVVHLLRTSAFLNGRQRVDLMDLFLILHCLWDHPSQLEPLREIVVSTIREHGYSIGIPLGILTREVERFETEINAECFVEHVDEEEVLTVIDDTWYRLEKGDEQFEGVRIRISDFNRLSIDEQTVANYYDEQGKLVNRLSTQKSRNPFTLHIEHNSAARTYRLLTHKRERRRRIRRKAHPLIISHWNSRFEALNNDLAEALRRLTDERHEHWDLFEKHLFTDQRLAPFVKANLEEVHEQLEQLTLQLNKLRYRYEQADA
jgi:MoxR-like ATPase